MRTTKFGFAWFLCFWLHQAQAFLPLHQSDARLLFALRVSGSPQETASSEDVVSKMRVSEIKRELDSLQIDYTDCFDKESMVKRLIDAKDGTVKPKDEKVPKKEEAESPRSDTSTEFDRDAAETEIRAMSVRDLREELGRRQISRSGLLEKEDLIQALLTAREQASVFSATGIMTPGKVSDLTGEQVEAEMKHTSTPMLLDCYATWVRS